jgi:hypothetical protein
LFCGAGSHSKLLGEEDGAPLGRTIGAPLWRAGLLRKATPGRLRGVQLRMASERFDGDAPRSVPPSSGGVPVSAREFAARYAAVAVLDEGPLGKWYRARDKQRDNREVALTVLASRFSRDDALVGRFFQDVRTAQSLVSPRVVEILDVGQIDDGRLFLATELVEGESLRARLAREGALRRPVALEIARQVLLALAAGHAKSLAHGQVTAGHVWLEARVPKSRDNPEGVGARLYGFGMAALYAAAATPSAAETEAAVPSEEPGPAEDLRAVAKLLIGMLRGQTLDGEPGAGDLTGLDAPTRQALERALDRKRGFANATDFSRALGSLLTAVEKHPLPRFAVAGLVMLGIAALAEGFWLLEQRAQTQQLEREATELQAARLVELRTQEQACAARIDEMERAISAREKDIQDLVADIAERKAEFERQQAAAASRRAERGAEHRVRPRSRAGPGPRARAHPPRPRRGQARAPGAGRQPARDAGARARAGDPEPGPRGPGAARGAHREGLRSARRPPAVRPRRGRARAVRAVRARRHAAAGRSAHARPARRAGARFGGPGGFRAHARPGHAARRARALRGSAARQERFRRRGERVDRPEARRRARAARLSALEGLASKLERDLAAANTQIAGAHESDWERLAAQTRKGDPAAILAHARRFGCDHVAGWVQDVADALTREVLRGPHLDVERLCTQSVLEPWSAALANDPALRALVGADVVAELAAARDWYLHDGADAARDVARDAAVAARSRERGLARRAGAGARARRPRFLPADPRGRGARVSRHRPRPRSRDVVRRRAREHRRSERRAHLGRSRATSTPAAARCRRARSSSRSRAAGRPSCAPAR